MNTLFDTKVTTVEELQKNWRDPYLLWYALGMPSYDQQDAEPWKQLTVKFRTKEDREHFSNLYDYNLTEKANAIWYPKKERHANILNRYIEDGFETDAIYNSKFEVTDDE